MKKTPSATPLLRATASLCAVTLIASLFGIFLDPRQVTGVPAWLKPFKFSLSILILLWTYAQYWKWLPQTRTLRLVFNSSCVLLAIEILLIVLQAARGVPSHFNLTTAFDLAVFSAMGISIAIFWFGGVFLFWAFMRTPLDRQGFVRAARLGLFLGTIGMGMAWKMTGPRPDQMNQIHQAGSPIGGIWGGGHSVGVPEDAPGIPIADWKKDGGDLRVAHFIGLHAMQILWLLTLLIARFWPDIKPRRLAVLQWTSSATILVLTLQQYWRALGGLPFI